MFVSPCSHVQQSVKLVTELIWVFWCIYVQFDSMNEMSKSFSSKKSFLIWYQTKLLDASISRVYQIKFGNFFNFSFTIVVFFKLFSSTIVVFLKLFQLSQWQTQQQLMLPPQSLRLLHKIHIISMTLRFCISWRKSKSCSHFSTINWGRKLSYLGKISEKVFDCQE